MNSLLGNILPQLEKRTVILFTSRSDAPMKGLRMKALRPVSQAGISGDALLQFSPRQQAVFWSRAPLLYLPGKLRGEKRHILAAWAIYRLLTRPGWTIDIVCADQSGAGSFTGLCASLCQVLRVAIGRPPARRKALPTVPVQVLGIHLRPRWSTLRCWPATAQIIRSCQGDDLILDSLPSRPGDAAIGRAVQDWLRRRPGGCCRIASLPRSPGRTP